MDGGSSLITAPVTGWPGYEVSTNGDVFGPRKKLKPWVTRVGYEQVKFQRGSLRKSFSVHRLVAEAFLPNPSGLPQVNHINGVKTDNRVINLEWVSPRENKAHAMRIGRHRWADRTACPNGHSLDPENRFTRPNGKTECRLCRREADRRRAARKRAASH